MAKQRKYVFMLQEGTMIHPLTNVLFYPYCSIVEAANLKEAKKELNKRLKLVVKQI